MATKYAILPVYDKRVAEYDHMFADSDYYEGYESVLVRLEDDTLVEIIGDDGCEPEDAILARAFSWVLPAVNDAYRRGAQDALKGKLDE